MIGSPGTRWVAIGAVVLLVAACGDNGSGANAERYCEIETEFEQLDDPFELPPNEARETVLEGRDLLDESVRVAPDEIRSSVKTSVDSFMPIIDLFEAADFDATQIDQAEIDALFKTAFSGENEQASEAVEAWVTANCSG